MEQRYRKTKDQKPWPGFSRNHDFVDERGLQPKVKLSKSGDALSKLVSRNVSQTGVWGQSPEPLGNFLYFFGKNSSYFNAIKSHFARF